MVEDGQFAYNSGTVRVMCHKETNTDWSAVGSGDQSQSATPDTTGGSQSRSDGSYSSSIRRWQTFSPPGAMGDGDGFVCKVRALTWLYVCVHICSVRIVLHHSASRLWSQHVWLDVTIAQSVCFCGGGLTVGPIKSV